MSTARRRWWLGVLIFALLSVGVAWLTSFLARHGIEWSAKVSEIASFVLAVVVALLPAAGRFALRLPTPKVRVEQVESDVSDLAAALRAQGRTESALPGVSVYDRLPMQVRWKLAGTEAGDGSTGTFHDVIGFFRGLPEQRLMVLGKAGAGKSVLVTELARSLLAHRGNEDPVPVIFSMVGWEPEHTTLFDWISGQLARINPDLGQKVSDGGQVVTRAQVLVDRLKVLPILDGLDEVGDEALPVATLAVNRYGWTQPLVVTCRGAKYLEAVATEPGTPLARATTIVIVPLTGDDISRYLEPDLDGRWTAVRDQVVAEPDSPLARVLGNPLMLWLSWEVYRSPERKPAELTDRHRFGRPRAIESRLLNEFVPAVYPARRQPLSFPPWQFRPTARQARRWLGFLASDRALRTKKPTADWERSLSRWAGEQLRDDIETHDKSVAWWHFTAATRGIRFLGVAIRAIVLWIVLWHQITTILSYAGNWRHGMYIGHLPFRRLFLDGPAGRYIWPTVRQAIDVAPTKTRDTFFTTLNTVLRHVAVIPSHYPFFLILAVIPFVIGYASSAEPRRPRRLRMPAWLPVSLVTAAGANVLALAVAILVAMGYWGRTGAIADFFTTRRTWLVLLVLALGSMGYRLPRLFVAEIDIVGATTPLQSLREDRLAAVTTTLSRRALFAVTLALFCGSLLATTYALFAVVSTATMLALGGLTGFASSSYTDASRWLAITGRLPWRPMAFLMDAERRGVFVEVGAVFRFRHIRLQLALKDWYRTNQTSRGDLASRLARLLIRLLDKPALSWIPVTRELVTLRNRVDSYRTLAERNMAEFGPPLLLALDELATVLALLRQRDEEITIRGEITAISRQMTALGYTPPLTLAVSLEGLACCLAEAGLAYEAFGVMTEAADICRQVPSADRREFERRLAAWVKLFPSEIGTRRYTPELDAAADAMADVYRDLVLAETDTKTVAHAESLRRMAQVLRHQRRQADAANALKDAAQIYRELVHSNATAPEPAHAGKLLELVEPLRLAGLSDDAIAALTDVIDAYRALAEADPEHADAYNVSRARALVKLAYLLSQDSRPGQLDALRQAVGIYRALADGDGPRATVTGQPLGDVRRIATWLWELGETGDALAAAQIARQLAEVHASDDGTQAKADQPPQEADARLRSLMRQASGPPRRIAKSAHDLDTLAFQLLIAGRTAESRTASEAAARASEAAVIKYRALAADLPADYLPHLASSLDDLAAYLGKVGSRETEAAAAAAEARDIRQRLTAKPD